MIGYLKADRSSFRKTCAFYALIYIQLIYRAIVYPSVNGFRCVCSFPVDQIKCLMWSSNLTQWCRWKPDKFTFRWQTAIGGKLGCISTSHYTRWKYCSWNNHNRSLFKYVKKVISLLFFDVITVCPVAWLSFEKRKLLSLSNSSQSYQPALLIISHFPYLNTCLHSMCICWYYSAHGHY